MNLVFLEQFPREQYYFFCAFGTLFEEEEEEEEEEREESRVRYCLTLYLERISPDFDKDERIIEAQPVPSRAALVE